MARIGCPPGTTPWNKGLKLGPHSEETKRKQSEGIKAHWQTHTHPAKGKRLPREQVEKMRQARMGHAVSPGTRQKIADAVRGEKNYMWKGGKPKCLDCGKQLGSYYAKRCNPCEKVNRFANHQHITPINNRIRRSKRYKEWRTAIYERDNYTCQFCGYRGKGLRADHIKPFAYYPELRFELSNGRTLCDPCHFKTDTYGSKATKYRLVKIAKEKEII